MRKRDEPSIYPEALCCAGCRKPWEKWCRGCNLVYCSDHVDRKSHTCKLDEPRPYPPKEEVQAAAPAEEGSTAPPNQTQQLDLFGPSQPKDIASPQNGH